MKLLLGIAFFVISALCRVPKLEEVNLAREIAANHSGVPLKNLTWDVGLVAEINSMDDYCTFLEHNDTYRFSPYDPDEVGIEMFRKLLRMVAFVVKEDEAGRLSDEVVEKLENIPTLSFFQLEFLNPAQETIGCAEHKCSGVLSQNQNGRKKYSFRVLCLLGPSRDYSFDDLKKVTKDNIFLLEAQKEIEEVETTSTVTSTTPTTTVTRFSETQKAEIQEETSGSVGKLQFYLGLLWFWVVVL